MENCIPLILANKLSSKYPGCWGEIESFRRKKDDGDLNWDDHCYIPIGATLAITVPTSDYDVLSEEILELASDASTMAAIAPWRKNMKIFSFSPEEEERLLSQGKDCALSIETLHNLPYPSIYIKINTIEYIDGFFVHLESDERRMELRFLVACEDNSRAAIPIHLIQNGTLKDGLLEALSEAKISKCAAGIPNEWDDDEIFSLTAALFQLALNICSSNSKAEERQAQNLGIRKVEAIRNMIQAAKRMEKDDKIID